jgi:iron complex outermembrane receptor protein
MINLKLRSSILIAGVLAAIAVQPAWAGNKTWENEDKILRVSNLEQISTSAANLLVQQPNNSAIAQVTEVKISPTETGVEILLVTTNSDNLQISASSQGNSYIAEIPNAQLNLPTGKPFRQAKPVAGIREVTAINQDDKTVRVTITGETNLPTVELFDSEAGLIFSAVSTVASTPPAQQEVTPVTGVQLNPTETGLELILQTPPGKTEQLQPNNFSEGNRFIADIPNAQLQLLDGKPFRQVNPIEGVSEVTVINQNENTVRVTATGTTALPQVELFDSDAGLIFGLTPVESSAQTPPTQPSTPGEIVTVTGVQLNPTETGLEILLQTPPSQAERLQPNNFSEGNRFIADIPNAQLQLPDGKPFRQVNPVAGISEVTVTNQDASTIRIAAIGETASPQVELFDSDAGLIFGLTPVDSSAQTPTTAEEVVAIDRVQLNPTDTGFEIVLLTPTGVAQKLRVVNVSQGNNFIAEIPNAQLQLADGKPFRQENPAEGVSEITVSNQNENTIRVTAVGEEKQPMVELFDSDEGLVFSAQTETTESAQGEEDIQLVVTATRTEEDITNVPRSVTVIPRERIEQEASLDRSLVDILSKTVPGFSLPTNRANTFGATLRGRDISVLIDGVPQNTNFQVVPTQLNTIDPNSIERIEVVRGPNAIYGAQATGGVINIITRKPSEEFTATTEIGAGFSATHSADSGTYNLLQSISDTEGIFDYTVNVSYLNTNGFFDAEGDRISQFAGQEDSEIWNGLLKLGLDIDDKQRLQFTFNYYNQDQDAKFIPDESTDEIPGIQQARSLRLPDGTRVIGSRDGSYVENILANLSYSNEDIFGSELQFQAYYQQNYFQGGFPIDDRDFFTGLIFTAPGDRRLWGGRLQIKTPFNRENTLSLLWGVDYSNERSSQNFDVFDPDELDESGGRIYRKIGELTYTPEYEVDDLGLFAQLQWDVTDNLQLSGGLRHVRLGIDVDNYTTFDGIEIEGGQRDLNDTVFNAGILYKPTDEIGIFANFAQGFSVPDIGDVLREPPEGFINVSDGIRLTEPQKVDNYEIGIRGEWEAVQATLSAFYNYSDLGVDFRRTDEFIETIRAPQKVYGIEATIDVQPADDWQFGSTFTWLEGENDLPDDDRGYVALTSTTIPPLKITAYVENETLPGWRNRLQLLYSGSRDRAFEDEVDGKAIDSYVTLDLISSIKVGESGELQIAVQNLLNSKYFPVYSQSSVFDSFDSNYYAAPGTTLSFTYRFKW